MTGDQHQINSTSTPVLLYAYALLQSFRITISYAGPT